MACFRSFTIKRDEITQGHPREPTLVLMIRTNIEVRQGQEDRNAYFLRFFSPSKSRVSALRPGARLFWDGGVNFISLLLSWVTPLDPAELWPFSANRLSKQGTWVSCLTTMKTTVKSSSRAEQNRIHKDKKELISSDGPLHVDNLMDGFNLATSD